VSDIEDNLENEELEAYAKQRYRWLWVLALALLIVVGVVFMLNSNSETAPPAAEDATDMATVPSDDYTTAPEEPGVDVDLPDTAPAVEVESEGEGQ
jgi:hypothetical protein